MAYVAAIDIGGTHTDCVASDGSAVQSAKVPTTADPTDGVIHGLEMLAGKFDTDLAALLGDCDRFVYGSTTATNIFVQRRLPKTGLLCTHGHRDILWFREGNKPDRWNLRTPPPWSLLDRHLRRPVRERIDQTGDVIVPLEEQDVRDAVGQLRDEGVEAVAIAFLWSFLNPAHERRAQQIAREELGDGVPVLTSVDVLPVIREWERTFCTVLSAGIMVETRAHLESFRARMSQLGLKGEPLVMQCNGGHATIDAILKNPLPLVASGPAGGALAGVYYGELTDSADVMTIDTGGTSFDVCVLPGRSIPITRAKRLDTEPISIPSVDVHTIGAGGGSIAWLDGGGALRVGPQSAGANPGPACYGRGGTEPTLTDAFLHLGYINPDYFLGGRTALQPALADRAIREKIAEPLGLDLTGAAARIVEIMNSRLAGAMRLLSVERGIDPRSYTLLVGGGAGPLQAGTLASRLGISRVIVPRWPGVLCASGLMRADVTHNLVRSFNTTAEAADLDRLSAVYGEMERALIRTLEEEGIALEDMALSRFIDARYSGQVYEIETPVSSAKTLTADDLKAIVAAFEDAHEVLYHYRMEGYPAEFVSCRVEAVGRVDAVTPEELPAGGADPSAAAKGSRLAYLPEEGRFEPVETFDGERLEPGNRIVGTAIIETEGSTLVVWRDQRLTVNRYGDFEIDIGA
ncbi:MAG: hydantoinase/oxoprolinase family protein [Rhodospirillaceae bacterium]|nr:hydantoinase/oxoprolinase family protein [Rhodospirillaceae bacterium]